MHPTCALVCPSEGGPFRPGTKAWGSPRVRGVCAASKGHHRSPRDASWTQPGCPRAHPSSASPLVGMAAFLSQLSGQWPETPRSGCSPGGGGRLACVSAGRPVALRARPPSASGPTMDAAPRGLGCRGFRKQAACPRPAGGSAGSMAERRGLRNVLCGDVDDDVSRV